MIWFQNAALVGLAGFVGAILRFVVTVGVTRIAPRDFPYGTLIVNLTGCFLLALIVTWVRDRWPTDGVRLAVTVGFVGAYTTFSTFAVEVFDLYRSGGSIRATAYMAASVGLGLIAVWMGMLAGRRLEA